MIGMPAKIELVPFEGPRDLASVTARAPLLSRCTKLGDLENKEWFVALNWETPHTNCT